MSYFPYFPLPEEVEEFDVAGPDDFHPSFLTAVFQPFDLADLMASIAPMDDQANEGNQAIPLECVLCPSNPKFSDVSHLLTHVSSKSHLHHEFQTKVKADDQDDAAEKLRRYTQWFDDNNIKLLIKERLQTKESKKKPGTAARRRTGTRELGGASTNNTGKRQTRKGSGAMDNYAMKAEPDTPFAVSGGLPPMGHFNTAAMNTHSLQQPDHDAFFGNGGFPNSTARNNRIPFAFEGYSNDPFHSGPTVPVLRSNTQTPDSANPSVIDMENTEDADGASKLKGTIWPGMSMFDSATPDQKRKRNQRKHRGVIEYMEASSKAVTPTECVWEVDGTLQKKRDIYASPSIDGSPSDREEAADKQRNADNHKKRRARRTAPASAEESPLSNTRPGLRSSTRLANKPRLLGNDHNDDNDHEAQNDTKQKAKKRVGGRRAKKPDGFDVFQDPRQDSPGRTESPGVEKRTSRFALPPHPVAPLADMSTNDSLLLASPTPAMKQHSTRVYGSGIEAQSFQYPQQPSFAPPPFLTSMSGGGYNNNPLHNPHPNLHHNPHHNPYPASQHRPAMAFHNRPDAALFDESLLAGSQLPHRMRYPEYNTGRPAFTDQP